MLDIDNHEFTYDERWGHSMSGEIEIYRDPEWLAYVTILDSPPHRLPFFHVRTAGDRALTPSQMKRFARAIPEMKRRVGRTMYAMFVLDNPRRAKFALHFGWEHIGELSCSDDRVRQIYRMHCGPYLFWDGSKLICKGIDGSKFDNKL